MDAGTGPTNGRRREEFYIHPEILLGGAAYRRVTDAGDEPPAEA